MAAAAPRVPPTDAVNSDSSKRYRLFKEFHKRVGLKPFCPEFADSLVHTMRTPGIGLTEQVWAWVRWRSWLNSSESPVSDWNPETAYQLNQKDCALDLWWFQQGKSVEWVEGVPREYRERERKQPEIVKLKTAMNDAFVQLKVRGHIDMDGHRIYALVSPQVVGSSSKIPGTRDFSPKDTEFMAWWKSLEPGIFQEYEESLKRYVQAKKIARNRYRQYLGSRNSGQGILITVITSNELGNTHTEENGVCVPSPEALKPEEEKPAPPPPIPVRIPEPLSPLPLPPEPEETKDSFSERHREQRERVKQAFNHFKTKYKATVYPADEMVFLRTIRTDADIDQLFSVLAVYNESGPVKRGKIFSARAYLERGVWCTLPKPDIEPPGPLDYLRRLANGDES